MLGGGETISPLLRSTIEPFAVLASPVVPWGGVVGGAGGVGGAVVVVDGPLP